jgi:anti-sigma factor RsiW
MGYLCFVRDRDLSRFLDGELPLSGHRRVQEHVRSCPRCARRLNEFRSVDQRVAGLPEVIWPRPEPTRMVVAAAVAAALVASLAANLFLPAAAPSSGFQFRSADGPSDALNRLYAHLSRPGAER